MRVGVTGHQRLADDAAWAWVDAELRRAIRALPRPLEGWSSLAAGADQRFAEAVLEAGGTLHAVVPFAGYERAFATDAGRQAYRALLARAATTETLPWPGDDEAAFLAAGRRIVAGCDLLVAVWTGRGAAGPGGTADVVADALTHGRRVLIIDPEARAVRVEPSRASPADREQTP